MGRTHRMPLYVNQFAADQQLARTVIRVDKAMDVQHITRCVTNIAIILKSNLNCVSRIRILRIRILSYSLPLRRCA